MRDILGKFLKLVKQRRTALIILVIFWVLLISIQDPFSDMPAAERVYGESYKGGVEIQTGQVISEEIPCSLNGLCELNIQLSNKSDDPEANTALIKVDVLDNTTNQVVASQTIAGSKISSLYTDEISFSPLGDSKDKTYTLRFYCIKSKEINTGILVLTHDSLDTFEREARIGEKWAGAAFTFTAGFKNNITSFIYFFTWLLLIAVTFICTLLLGKKFEKNFLIIGISIGIMYLIFNPYPQQVDESTHFFRSYQISQGNFEDVINADGKIGGYVSDNYPQNKVKFSPLNWYANRECFNQPFSENEVFSINPYMSSVNPIDHAISAIGIAIGRAAHLPIALIIYIARFCDYLFYMIFCYLAIRKARYYRSVFFGVALLPICLFLAGSCSQDPILIASSLYFVSSWSNLYFADQDEGTIGIKELLPMLCMIPFIASIKYLIYVPIFLLFFLIPRKVFKKKRRLAFCLITIALCVIFLAYQLQLLNAFPFTEDRNGNVNVKEQIIFVFQNMYYSYKNIMTFFFDSFITQSQSLALYPDKYSILMGVIVVLGAIFAKDKYVWQDQKKRRTFAIITIGISAVIFLLVTAALYVGFTPVGQWGVDGVQTRYAIPYIPMICMALSCISVTNNIEDYEYKQSYMIAILNAALFAQYCLLG